MKACPGAQLEFSVAKKNTRNKCKGEESLFKPQSFAIIFLKAWIVSKWRLAKKKKKLQVRTILLNLIQNIFTSLLNASLTRGGRSYRRPSTLYVDKCNWSLSQALPILQYYFDCLHLIRAKGQTIDFPTTSLINCESNMVHQRNYICHFLCRWKNAVVDWNGSEPILWCSLALNSIKPGVPLWRPFDSFLLQWHCSIWK